MTCEAGILFSFLERPCYRSAMPNNFPQRALTFSLVRRVPLCTAVLLAVTASVFAQTSQTSPATHVDPKTMMLEAAKHNGLGDPSLPPWKLRVSFNILDDDGKVTDAGIFEDYHISLSKYRLSWTSKAFTQTLISTGREGAGPFRSGAEHWAEWPLRELWPAFAYPIPPRNQWDGMNLEPIQISLPSTKADCVRMARDVPDIGDPTKTRKMLFGMYCFAPGTTELKASVPIFTSTGAVIVRVSSVQFQDRFIPKDIIVTREGKVVLTAHLEYLEAITQVDEAVLVPPADAKMLIAPPPPPPPPPPLPQSSAQSPISTIEENKAAPGRFGVAGAEVLGSMFGSGSAPKVQAAPPREVQLSAGVATGMLIEKTEPIYPPVAKAARVSGIVVLQAVISREGLIQDLHVLSGPPLLQGAALDAVKKWRYRPYLLNDEPVEVLTTINVIFTLGG